MHVPLTELWLPIVLSSVAVFMASFLAWTVSPHHKGDIRQLPNEDGFLEAIRTNKTPPGFYMFPWCGDHKALKDPAVKSRWLAGPHGTLSLRGGPPRMGVNMLLIFACYLVVGVFVAYLASLACGPGAEYLHVFQVAGCSAVLAYCLALYPYAICMGRPIRGVILDTIDGVVYGLLTAGFFGWLWPRGLEAVAG